MKHWLFPSSRDHTDLYEVKLDPHPTPHYTCDCPGFVIHKKCKHSRIIKEYNDLHIEYIGDY